MLGYSYQALLEPSGDCFCLSPGCTAGYLSKAHLILATGKGYSHRPYLRDGIYADLTLIYQDKKFCSLPWTYPDYADEKQHLIFSRIRARYLLQLKETEYK